MQLKKVEVGIVKHKLTRLDDFNFEHTWVRLKLKGDLEPEDDSQDAMKKLRDQIQEEAEAWLAAQPGYEAPVPAELDEITVDLLEESDAASSDIIPD